VPSLIKPLLHPRPAPSALATFLREAGLRPLVVDWGAPGDTERGFGLDDYIAGAARPRRIRRARQGGRPTR